MKIGMTSLTLRSECVENVIKYAKVAGIEGIEWGVSDLHMPICDKEQAEKIKALSKEIGIEIFSLGGIDGFYHASVFRLWGEARFSYQSHAN